EAALLQVVAQSRRFLVREHPLPRLAQVGDRILEQLRVVEGEDVGLLRVRVQVAELVDDLHEVLFARRVVMRPRQPLRRIAVVGAVADADEQQHDDRRAGPPHGLSFFAWRSRIARVLRARSVSSFSISASYAASLIDPFFSRSPAICCSIALRSSTSAFIAGSLVSTLSASSARPVPRNSEAAKWPAPAGPPSSITACSVSRLPFCWNACTTLVFANSNASPIDTCPLRSRSADG